MKANFLQLVNRFKNLFNWTSLITNAIFTVWQLQGKRAVEKATLFFMLKKLLAACNVMIQRCYVGSVVSNPRVAHCLKICWPNFMFNATVELRTWCLWWHIKRSDYLSSVMDMALLGERGWRRLLKTFEIYVKNDIKFCNLKDFEQPQLE